MPRRTSTASEPPMCLSRYRWRSRRWRSGRMPWNTLSGGKPFGHLTSHLFHDSHDGQGVGRLLIPYAVWNIGKIGRDGHILVPQQVIEHLCGLGPGHMVRRAKESGAAREAWNTASPLSGAETASGCSSFSCCFFLSVLPTSSSARSGSTRIVLWQGHRTGSPGGP